MAQGFIDPRNANNTLATVAVRFPTDQIARINRLAAEKNISFAAMVRVLVLQGMKANVSS
jgi:hypothetical protein